MTDQELDGRFESFAKTLKSEITAEIKAEGEITRRHFDVVADGFKADVRIIAEGHDALRADVAELKAGQGRLEAGQGRLEIRQLALEHRQGKLEERQERLEGRQERLEGRQERLEGRQERLEGRQGAIEGGQQALINEVRSLAARLPA
jgi:uncharacterized protein (DUF3084 family)